MQLNEQSLIKGARSYQKDYLENHLGDEYHFLEWEMGTGKSFAIIREACYLWNVDEIDALVIIAPAGMYENWLNVEWPKHVTPNIYARCYTWQGKNTIKDKHAREEILATDWDTLRIVVINMESVSSAVREKKKTSSEANGATALQSTKLRRKRKGRGKPTKGAEFLEAFLKSVPDQRTMMVFDESEHLANPSNRTIQVLKMAKHCKYRRALSGTAIRNSPFDLYHQLEFLKPGITGCRNFHLFKHHYGIWFKEYTNWGSYDALETYRNLDELKELRESVGTTVRKKDMEKQLPPKQFVTRNVELTPQQRRAYTAMLKELRVELESGKTVTAQMALQRLLRLHQIVLGFLSVDDEIHRFPHNRGEALLEVLRESNYAPAIIWTHSIPSLREVSELIVKETGKPVAMYFGDTNKEMRHHYVKGFQNGDVNYFIANPAVGGYGLTLTRAEMVVYYSNSYKLTERLQSEDRVHRDGLEHSVLYVDLVARGTVDEKVLEAIENKINIASSMGVCYRDFLETQ